MTLSDVASCLPDHMHWFSRQILDYYLDGRLNTGEFLRWFHMPNSDYMSASQCVAHLVDPGHDPMKWEPGVMDGYRPRCPMPHNGECVS